MSKSQKMVGGHARAQAPDSPTENIVKADLIYMSVPPPGSGLDSILSRPFARVVMTDANSVNRKLFLNSAPLELATGKHTDPIDQDTRIFTDPIFTGIYTDPIGPDRFQMTSNLPIVDFSRDFQPSLVDEQPNEQDNDGADMDLDAAFERAVGVMKEKGLDTLECRRHFWVMLEVFVFEHDSCSPRM